LFNKISNVNPWKNVIKGILEGGIETSGALEMHRYQRGRGHRGVVNLERKEKREQPWKGRARGVTIPERK